MLRGQPQGIAPTHPTISLNLMALHLQTGPLPVFLYSYGKFIVWPKSAFYSVKAPFRLCVLGKNPFGEALNLAVANETVKGRKIAVRYTYLLKNTFDCNILYI